MMRLSREHGPNGKPLLRAFKPQTGVRTHLRGAAPTEISQVSEAPRPSCAICEKLLISTSPPSSGEWRMHMVGSFTALP